MRRQLSIAIVILLVLAGLFVAKAKRAPRPAPPTTPEIWATEGIPVTVATIVNGDMERTVEVTGDIDALKKVVLSAKIPGRVAEVYAREGDHVSQGQVIVMLDQQDARSNLQQAEAGLNSARVRLSQAKTTAKVTHIQTDSAIEQAKSTLAAAQAKLAVAKKPSRTQEEMVAENAVASAKANLDNAQADYKRYQELSKEGAASASTLDSYATRFKIAQADYKSAMERLDLMRSGGRSEDVQGAQAQAAVASEQLRAAKANASQNLLRAEDVKQAQAAIVQAQAVLSLAKQQLANTYIKSPISGQMSTRQTEPGQVVAAGQPLGQVVNLGSLYFKGDVSENELAHVSVGQQVDVGIDALPGKTFAGKLLEIFPAGSEVNRNFPVRISIASNGEIRPGMFARGKIVTGINRNVMLIPKDAVDERRGTTMVFTIEPKTVKVGKKMETVEVARRHDVNVVYEDSQFAQVSVPVDLKVGNAVATSGRQNLAEGAKVSVSNGK